MHVPNTGIFSHLENDGMMGFLSVLVYGDWKASGTQVFSFGVP